MYEKFRAVGITHQSSSIETREKLAFSEEEGRIYLERIKEIHNLPDLFLLSTCNRTEIYYSSESNLDSDLIAVLAFQKSLKKSDIERYFFQKEGSDAVNHLYHVALGLDAKVLGDMQISNQVKRAYQMSADLDTAGPLLHRLMHSVFYANKRVVQETGFRDGAASVSYAAAEIIRLFIENYQKPKILLIGTGEIGRDVADNLSGIEAEVTLTNRTLSKAKNLANILDFKLTNLSEALSSIDDFDVIVSSTSGGILIEDGMIKSSQLTQKLLIDLSVPRSIDPELENKQGVIVYNIDQIEEKTTSVLKKREAAVADVKTIVKESVSDLTEWARDMEVSPTIKKLKSALEKIRQDEIARHLKNVDEKESELIDKVTKNIIQKVIKLPVLQLKAACKRGEADTLVDVLNDLFDLEKDNQKTPAK